MTSTQHLTTKKHEQVQKAPCCLHLGCHSVSHISNIDEKPVHLRSHVLVAGLPRISHEGLHMGCNICKRMSTSDITEHIVHITHVWLTPFTTWVQCFISHLCQLGLKRRKPVHSSCSHSLRDGASATLLADGTLHTHTNIDP